ncbi:hypothetical protein [Jiangella anatolica]|uniref:Uncharacterized protein n=1 Tax=Jiangella anatolica TaxID=2670374 RepID=A0A2W2B9Q0_9ACTN|nr:hypothetical protein [Jiangella anatolica]PZF82842.1 hypothetical protein C1I92_15170 [Jiangella anatolica]
MPDTDDRSGRFRALRDWSVLALVILLPAAVWPAILGLMHLVPGFDGYEACVVNRNEEVGWDGSAGLEVRSDVIPLSHVCLWDDGYSAELVPSWANPTLAFFSASIALATAGVTTGVVMSRRDRNQPEPSPGVEEGADLT